MTKHKIQNKPKAQIPMVRLCSPLALSKVEVPNNKTLVLTFVILIFNLFCALNFDICHLYAQDNSKLLITLTKEVMEAKNNQDIYVALQALKNLYLDDKKYAEFIEFLKSLSQKKNTLEPFVNYYIGLSRYEQLKHLEETQDWNEYFNNGPAFRDELVTTLQKTIDSTKPSEALHLYSRLIIWQFHKDQTDASEEPVLLDLMKSVLDYSKEALDPKPIKDIADKLLAYGEKGKSRELYKLYVNRIATADISDNKLRDIALGFLLEGNLELSESIYDVYIERILKAYSKEKSIPILIDIAKSFSYSTGKSNQGQLDAFYAEKLFKKIEELGKKDVFDEELMYLRAFNLEKAKEYSKARDFYVELVSRFPETTHANEAWLKAGLIYTYILDDIKSGSGYFEGLAQKEAISPEVILSLYQLGLLSQWENDFFKARDYYNKVLEKAGDDFRETVTFTQERLREITELKPIEYNLKTFLDVSLKQGDAVFDRTKLDLKSSGYKIEKGLNTTISSTIYNIESGCMQVQVQYLWSGDIGTTKPSIAESTFNTSYTQPGIKVINLVAVSPAGVIDRNIEIVDVY